MEGGGERMRIRVCVDTHAQENLLVTTLFGNFSWAEDRAFGGNPCVIDEFIVRNGTVCLIFL